MSKGELIYKKVEKWVQDRNGFDFQYSVLSEGLKDFLVEVNFYDENDNYKQKFLTVFKDGRQAPILEPEYN